MQASTGLQRTLGLILTDSAYRASPMTRGGGWGWGGGGGGGGGWGGGFLGGFVLCFGGGGVFFFFWGEFNTNSAHRFDASPSAIPSSAGESRRRRQNFARNTVGYGQRGSATTSDRN